LVVPLGCVIAVTALLGCDSFIAASKARTVNV
jgi:hypothetical protein